MNYDDWKLASPDTESCELVSPCCGSEFTDYVDNENFGKYKCDYCGEDFDEPTEDYEYAVLKQLTSQSKVQKGLLSASIKAQKKWYLIFSNLHSILCQYSLLLES